MAMNKIFLFILIPVFATAQTATGYTFTNESGDINVRQFDTITTPSGFDYRTTLISFPDSATAADYLEQRKNAYFEEAYRWAQKAHEDSTRANRIRLIGTDSGLFSVPEPAPRPPQIPELITLPEPVKLPATKQKKPRKQKKQ